MHEIWKLYVENYSSYRVRTKSLTKFRCDLDLWPLDPKMYWYLSLNILRLCMKHERCTLKTTQVIVSGPKCWQSSVMTLTFDPKMYGYLSLAILHLCMKYESCKMKTNQFIVSEPKCWQSSIVNLTIDLLAPKCIGIFLSPSCIYVWNMKAVRWKLLKLSCQNQSVDGQTDRQTDR